ncbi:MAG TPA: hypothetical protein VF603_03115 [Allosphingosinicella sp.]
MDIFGLPPASRRLAAGDQVRRAMVFGRNLNPVVAVEFRRARGNEPTVAIYLPRETDSALREPAISAPVPLAAWERVVEASDHFDRELVPLPPRPEPTSDDEIVIYCSDAWVHIVEATDSPDTRLGYLDESPRSRIRQRVEDTCSGGLANAYADLLVETARQLIPACRALEPRSRGADVLAICGILDGDRMAAAEAFNRLRGLRDARDPARLRSMFSDRIALDWQGTPAARREDATRLWLAGTRADGGAHLFFRRLVGDNANRVRVTAVLEKWTNCQQSCRLWSAPVELVAESRLDVFEISQARVGAFVQVPARCEPGRLDARGC